MATLRAIVLIQPLLRASLESSFRLAARHSLNHTLINHYVWAFVPRIHNCIMPSHRCSVRSCLITCYSTTRVSTTPPSLQTFNFAHLRVMEGFFGDWRRPSRGGPLKGGLVGHAYGHDSCPSRALLSIPRRTPSDCCYYKYS